MQRNYTRAVHVTLTPDTSLGEALRVISETGVDALAVLDRGKYVGAVTQADLARYAPSPASTLSKWEMSYLLEDISIKSGKLTRTLPIVEYKWDARHKLQSLLQSDNDLSAVAVMNDGQFSHLETWHDLCAQLLAEPQKSKGPELIQPKEFALSV